MGDLSRFAAGGGDQINDFRLIFQQPQNDAGNSIREFAYNNSDDVVTQNNKVYLKTGIIETNIALYPDAKVNFGFPTNNDFNLDSLIVSGTYYCMSGSNDPLTPRQYVLNDSNKILYVLGDDFSVISSFTVTSDTYNNSSGLAADTINDRIYVLSATRQIREFVVSTGATGYAVTQTSNLSSFPVDMCLGDSSLVVADQLLLKQFNKADGSYLSGQDVDLSSEFSVLYGIAFDGSHYYVSGAVGTAVAVKQFDTSFSLVKTFSASFSSAPRSISIIHGSDNLYTLEGDIAKEFDIRSYVGSPNIFSIELHAAYLRVK